MIPKFLDDIVKGVVEFNVERKCARDNYLSGLHEGRRVSLQAAENARDNYQKAKKRYDAAVSLVDEKGVSFIEAYITSKV